MRQRKSWLSSFWKVRTIEILNLEEGVKVPQNYTYVEYCGMESLCGKIQFTNESEALIPRALFQHILLLLDFDIFRFLWYVLREAKPGQVHEGIRN
jgi:hypothetical protein